MKKKLFIIFSAWVLVLLTARADYQLLPGKSGYGYTSYVVHYTSVGGDCVTPVTVSGVITVPTKLQKAGIWVIDNHYTITDNADAPSEKGTTDAGRAGLSSDYVVIATDYLGYGLTKEYAHPYLCQRQNALNSIDLLKVAVQVLGDMGISPNAVYNIGYSQGGGVAMAVHREMEADIEFARSVNFSGSWCGDGPYDPVATMNDIYAHKNLVSFPAILPLVVKGFLSGASDEVRKDYVFADFFKTEKLANSIEAIIDAKNQDEVWTSISMVAAAGFGLGLSSYFSKDMMDSNSQIYKDMYKFCEENIVCNGWKPTHFPIHLYHLKNDDIVTVANTERAAESLELTESYVHYVEDSSKDHASFGSTFNISVREELQALADDILTDIANNTNINNLKDNTIYDLYGRRVTNATKGIYIINNKKVLVR